MKTRPIEVELRAEVSPRRASPTGPSRGRAKADLPSVASVPIAPFKPNRAILGEVEALAAASGPQDAGPTHGAAAVLAGRNRQASLERRWNLITRALGADSVPRVRAGEKWSYFFEAQGPGEISYPIAELAKVDEGEALGRLGHEIGHWFYSRYPAAQELKQKAFHTLWNAVEDVRINRMIGTSLPGLMDLIRRADAQALDPQLRAQLIQKGKTPSRALQMAFAILYEGYSGGERDPLATHPDVLAAMREARPLIAEASRLPAGVDLRFEKMSEAQIVAEAERSFAMVRDRIWPIFSALIARDLEDPLHQEKPKDKRDSDSPRVEDPDHSESPEIEQEGGGQSGSSTGLEQSQGGGAAGDEAPPPDAKPSGKGGGSSPPDSAPDREPGEASEGSGPANAQGQAPADAGASNEADPWRLPDQDPLEAGKHGSDAGREVLEAQLEEAHQQLRRKAEGPKSGAEEPEGSTPAGPSPAPKGEAEEREAGGAGGRPAGTPKRQKKSLDELLGVHEQTPVEEDKIGPAVARWGELRDEHAVEIEALARALPNLLEARYSRPWLKEYGRDGRYDLARELSLKFKKDVTGVQDPNRRRLRGAPQRTDKPTILVFDISQSMAGPKGEASQRLMVIFTEAFERASAPGAALAYNHEVRVLTPPNGVRTPELYGACLNEMTCDGGNNEVAALDTTEEMLGQFGVPGGLVVFVTDTWAADPAPGEESCRDRVLRLERDTGAKVVAIDLSRLGVEQAELKPGQLPPFPNSRILERIEDLPSTFEEVVRDFASELD